jgi:hypothetical protein
MHNFENFPGRTPDPHLKVREREGGKSGRQQREERERDREVYEGNGWKGRAKGKGRREEFGPQCSRQIDATG